MTFAYAIVLCGLAMPFLVRAQAVNLGTAATFALLGATTVTNTGNTYILGDLGVSPGTAITGFPPGTLTGREHGDDPIATQAQADALRAYNIAAGLTPTADEIAVDLGGLTLTPGVYFFSSFAQLSGTLTLSAQGNPSALFVFQIGSTLTTSSNSAVSLINGAQACNVIWQVGSSATLGTGTAFMGIVLAHTSISASTTTTISGSLIALNGAVTLQDNVVEVVNTCTSAITTTGLTSIGTSLASTSSSSTFTTSSTIFSSSTSVALVTTTSQLSISSLLSTTSQSFALTSITTTVPTTEIIPRAATTSFLTTITTNTCVTLTITYYEAACKCYKSELVTTTEEITTIIPYPTSVIDTTCSWCAEMIRPIAATGTVPVMEQIFNSSASTSIAAEEGTVTLQAQAGAPPTSSESLSISSLAPPVVLQGLGAHLIVAGRFTAISAMMAVILYL